MRDRTRSSNVSQVRPRRRGYKEKLIKTIQKPFLQRAEEMHKSLDLKRSPNVSEMSKTQTQQTVLNLKTLKVLKVSRDEKNVYK